MPLEREKPNEGVQQALARFQSVDHLLVRPKLTDINDALNGPAGPNASRISLLDYQELEQKIKNFPADPIPYMQLAEIYDRQLRSKDTMRVLNAGVQHNPEYEPLVVFREELVLRAAQQSLQEAWRIYQQEPTDERELDWQRAQANLANEQIAFCQARYTRHPDQKELLIPWAAALRSLGRIEDAMQLLKQSIEVPDLRASSALELGQCYELSSQLLEAFSAYRTAALFRDPPPTIKIKTDALRKALRLAEKLNMIDAAKRYARFLLECNVEDQSVIQQQLERLQKKLL
jgi:tetratricopeptide (TPR) repeat protein